MSFLRNTKIRTSLLALLLPLSITGVAGIVASSSSYLDTSQNYARFIDHDGAATVALARINASLVITAYAANHTLNYTANDPYIKVVKENYKENVMRMGERFDLLVSLMPNMSDDFNALRVRADAILKMTDDVIALGLQDRDDEARAVLMKVYPAVASLRVAVRDKVDVMLKHMNSESQRMTADMQSTVLTYLCSLVGLFVALIIAAIYVSSRGIKVPINALRARMLFLADGKA